MDKEDFRHIFHILLPFPKPQIHSKYLKQKRPIRIPLYLQSEIFVCLLCLPCTVKCGEHYFIIPPQKKKSD